MNEKNRKIPFGEVMEEILLMHRLLMARSAPLRASRRREEEDFGELFTALKGRSSFSLRSPPTKVGGFHRGKSQKNRPKLRYRRGMYDFAEKVFASRLQEWGCPDTLVKDVRDVAAAVMCSEGPGQSGKMLNRLGFQVIYSKAARSQRFLAENARDFACGLRRPARRLKIASKAKPARLYSGT
jgi:hypothetical protein